MGRLGAPFLRRAPPREGIRRGTGEEVTGACPLPLSRRGDRNLEGDIECDVISPNGDLLAALLLYAHRAGG